MCVTLGGILTGVCGIVTEQDTWVSHATEINNRIISIV